MADDTLFNLHALAAAVGIARHWRDVEGRDQATSDEALVGILTALGHEAGSHQQIKHSLAAVEDVRRGWPAMIVTEVGIATAIPGGARRAEITGEDGVTRHVEIVDGHLGPIHDPGYYDLAIGARSLKLAVAPNRCPVPAADAGRTWGTTVQIPALHGVRPSAFGGFGELADAMDVLAQHGCDVVSINPVHAMFPGSGTNFSPYSPSSRTFLNTAMGDPALIGLKPLPESPATPLIDWPVAMPQRLTALRQSFAELPRDFHARFVAEPDVSAALRRHALFDSLDCHFRPMGANGWREWPEAYRDPDSPAVIDFGATHSDEVEFHVFAQRLARESLGAVQRQARAAGMHIGLVTDLAVGVHLSGSDTWGLRDTMLNGLTIGAPPDPLGPQGQNWCITGFSPAGLRASGYWPWIEMVRSALASAGGLRIDHAFGLARLWVIPEGESSCRGAYLDYPFLDLVRLLTLEAHRAAALIIAEDLGTAPFGFSQAIADRNMLGMRILWFERASDGGFIGAHDYPSNAVAMSGTHDTPTLGGWWSGTDLDWADKLGRLPDGVDRAGAEAVRDWDRGLLWSTLGDGGNRPPREDAKSFIDASIAHVARTPAKLAIVPIEDILGESEQPNLPGTTHEYPNWRRRLAGPLNALMTGPACSQRLQSLSGRKQRLDE